MYVHKYDIYAPKAGVSYGKSLLGISGNAGPRLTREGVQSGNGGTANNFSI